MSHVKPNLAQYVGHADMEVTKLPFPTLEWAARGRFHHWPEECYWFEFIGKHDALIGTGVAQNYMLAVGRSGKKSGPGYNTQRLANDRFRLELHTDHSDLEALISQRPTIGKRKEVAQHDTMSSYLQKVVSLIERYPPKLRPQLYGGLCNSGGNGWQLIESFPALAVRIFVVEDDIGNSARHLVGRGAKLRDIAKAANVPMCFKRVAPKATSKLKGLFELLSRYPEVVSHHCPEQERRQCSWLSVIAKANESGDEDFAIWVAIRWEELGDSPHWMREAVGDLNDWVRACGIAQAASGIKADDVEKICQAMLIARSVESADSLRQWWRGTSRAAEAGRPFNNKMSPPTVFRLSEEWHLRAAGTKAADVAFPEPWYEGDTVNDYRIEPIRTATELSRYAYRFHNCASTYAHNVARGDCFLYVVLKSNTPMAMLELKRDDIHTKLSQLKGPRNKGVSEELTTAVNRWFEAA